MRKKNLIAAAAVAALAAVAGCGPFWVDPYITVKESSLNWVSISYYNLNRTPIRRVKVDIWGNGLVEVKRGESELVTNDFAKRHESDEWTKIKSHRMQISTKDANDIFQLLVNFGLLDRYANEAGDDGRTITHKGFNVGLAFLF